MRWFEIASGLVWDRGIVVDGQLLERNHPAGVGIACCEAETCARRLDRFGAAIALAGSYTTLELRMRTEMEARLAAVIKNLTDAFIKGRKGVS